MKTRFLTLLIASLLTCTIWASNVITYTASSKLTETTSSAFYGLYENAFNVSITSHTFSNGTGTITFSDEVTSIGDYAFRGCSGLTSVTIPNSVTSIGNYAFRNCSGLTSVTIPNSVTSIGSSAFDGCSGITSVVWNAVNCASASYAGPFYSSCSQITSFTIGDEVETIPERLCYQMTKLTSLTIPNSVTSIGHGAFDGCSGITSVVWNAVNCTSLLSDGPFYSSRSQITSFTIGDEVETIPWRLCYQMTKLTSLTIPNSVTRIGHGAFYGCSGLTSVTIPDGVTSIGDYAFYGCSGLTSVNYTGTIADWCNIAFGDPWSNPTFYAHNLLINSAQITDLVIPNSVTSIGGSAFYGCSGLTSVTIPNSVTSIGKYAFYGCSGLTSVTIGNSVTSIGSSAFVDCSGLTSVTIPNSVTSIGGSAFYGCTNLQMITLGPSLTEVGDYAFYDCKRISEITCYARVTPDAYNHTFEGISRMAYLYVPAGSVRAYMIDSNWGVFDIHEIGAESTTIAGNTVLVEPSDNEAIFTWPMSDGASTYSLSITKNGVVFCTLTFNANGQLTNIAFAPLRNGSQHAQAASLTENGYQFTVTGLDYATNYAFSLNAKDATAQVVASYSGTFHTNGATALEDVQHDGVQIQKILRDGVLYILTPNGTFDATGRRVEE